MAIQRIVLDVLMEDDTTHVVRTNARDQQVWSETRARHGWPTMTEDEALFARFLGYAAMRRQGLFDGNYDAFCDAVSAVALHDDSAEVDPTSRAASPA